MIVNSQNTTKAIRTSEDLKKQMSAKQYQQAQSEFFELRKILHEKYVTLDADNDKVLIEALKVKICVNILLGGF